MGLTDGEMERTRRELAASLALAQPGSPAHTLIQAKIAAIDTELAARDTRTSSSAPRSCYAAPAMITHRHQS